MQHFATWLYVFKDFKEKKQNRTTPKEVKAKTLEVKSSKGGIY